MASPTANAIALGTLAFVSACAPVQTATNAVANNDAICQAFNAQQSRVEVVADGTVTRDLGLRAGRSGTHEGYLLRLNGGCNVILKVETNVDLTGPVPIRQGEHAIVKGEYEWTRLGGVLHWTHHDPRGRHEGGFVEVDGHTYQ
jgi:hypothetical protein